MSRSWRLTRQAEASLTDIARWTHETFGPRQAEAYKEDLIACCVAIAAGTAVSQDCRGLIDRDLPEDLRFARMGRHFVIFIEYPQQVIIVDFLHSRTDLPRRLAALVGIQRDISIIALGPPARYSPRLKHSIRWYQHVS